MKTVFEAFRTNNGKGGIRCIAISNKGSVFLGKAVCSTRDTFEMETGMQIAEKRAKLKQLSLIYEQSKKRQNYLRVKILKMVRENDKVLDKIFDLEEELNVLYGEELLEE